MSRPASMLRTFHTPTPFHSPTLRAMLLNRSTARRVVPVHRLCVSALLVVGFFAFTLLCRPALATEVWSELMSSPEGFDFGGPTGGVIDGRLYLVGISSGVPLLLVFDAGTRTWAFRTPPATQ